MSEEQLKAFIAKVQADTSLQEQLKAEGADPVAIAKASGFSITIEDLNAYRERELSNDELKGVAGAGEQSIALGLTSYEGKLPVYDCRPNIDGKLQQSQRNTHDG